MNKWIALAAKGPLLGSLHPNGVGLLRVFLHDVMTDGQNDLARRE